MTAVAKQPAVDTRNVCRTELLRCSAQHLYTAVDYGRNNVPVQFPRDLWVYAHARHCNYVRLRRAWGFWASDVHVDMLTRAWGLPMQPSPHGVTPCSICELRGEFDTLLHVCVSVSVSFNVSVSVRAAFDTFPALRSDGVYCVTVSAPLSCVR
ncbi:hypothetical protein SARC_06171 [Sphaeroforma arctica JP610]|uniref:Uncharacterized protein n=1 Tax=Sphaeroforma arctica JP610 TaxID=667725 RepID=A0A0L0FXD5_9EUKA|nr:hypothetical protein SARC_06171 [Sphaeroforma arctica JP610]KNC81505.1 hypothetical protein SARC_06171 [Sphaeroforma arctica JP610]|eukprot:XP_014155407.1 hypothetical protein SARC_06171 [Sphaeroforma arctica JP610]